MIDYPLNVTIDTNVFLSTRFDFSKNSTLSLLQDYVKNGKIKVYLSDIVVKETEKHLKEQVECAVNAINKRKSEVNKTVSDYIITTCTGINFDKINKEKTKDKAIVLLDDFWKKINISLLSYDTVNIDTILEDYFNIISPFEDNAEKRKEFPDAIYAAQIKNSFENQTVAIVSSDKGFMKAFNDKNNFLLFETLGELFDFINKNEESYNTCLNIIINNKEDIEDKIEDFIRDEQCFNVAGLSYDNSGIIYGFDYYDCELKDVSVNNIKVHTIDAVENDYFISTLVCTANFVVDCYYKDYDNAVWDHEDKDYIFLDTKINEEEHKANFPVVIKYDFLDNKIEVNANIVLGGDSRKKRHEISNCSLF